MTGDRLFEEINKILDIRYIYGAIKICKIRVCGRIYKIDIHGAFEYNLIIVFGRRIGDLITHMNKVIYGITEYDDPRSVNLRETLGAICNKVMKAVWQADVIDVNDVFIDTELNRIISNAIIINKV